MAREIGGDALVDEIDGRLDNLFSEDETPHKDAGKSKDLQDYPLRELKAIVLSIDWEITDDVMNRFVDQIALLKKRYRGDKIPFTFLQLLGSIGEYIRTNKAKSHQDAFKILNSLFTKLDKMVRTEGLAEPEKKKILSVELKKYKILKDKLASGKAVVQKEKRIKPEEKIKPEKKDMIPIEAFADAMDQVRQLIRVEFKALREELKLWRKGK